MRGRRRKNRDLCFKINCLASIGGILEKVQRIADLELRTAAKRSRLGIAYLYQLTTPHGLRNKRHEPRKKDRGIGQAYNGLRTGAYGLITRVRFKRPTGGKAWLV